MAKKNYTSPSNQDGNSYATGKTNKTEQCDKIANQVSHTAGFKSYSVPIAGYSTADLDTNDETDELNSSESWQNALDFGTTKKGNFYFDENATSTNPGKKIMDSRYQGALLEVSECEIYKITCRTTTNTVPIVFYTNYTYVEGTANGENFTVYQTLGEHSKNYTDYIIVVPKGANYMGLCSYTYGSYGTPLKVEKWELDNNTSEDDSNTNVYNVKSFGAYGDGEHDDTTAFQKCLEAANGNPIIVPSGIYVVNNTANNSVNYTGNVIMIGCGLPKLIRTETSDGNANSQTYQPMITIKDCKYVYITGINFDGQRDNFVDSNTNEWIGTAALYFLGNKSNISNITVENCIFENCSREAIYCGKNTENVLITHNTFNKVSANFWAHGGNIKNVIFENNYSILGRTKAVEFDIENGYRGEDIVVRGNKFTKLVQVAVMLSNCHNVIVENNEYDYWTGTMAEYSQHMGSKIKSEPYFVFASTDPDSTTDATQNYCSDIIVRNNKAVCHRFVNMNKSGDGDIIYKNINVYNNIAKCSNCFIRANNADNIISENNQIYPHTIYNTNGTESGNLNMGAHSIGTDVSNIYNFKNFIIGKPSSVPTASVTDGLLSATGFAFSDIIRLSLSGNTTITDIAFEGCIGTKITLFVTGATLTVTASKTIANSKSYSPNSVAEFAYNGSKWTAI